MSLNKNLLPPPEGSGQAFLGRSNFSRLNREELQMVSFEGMFQMTHPEANDKVLFGRRLASSLIKGEIQMANPEGTGQASLGRSSLLSLNRSVILNAIFIGGVFLGSFKALWLRGTYKSLCVLLVLILILGVQIGNAQFSDRFEISGYLQGMPVRMAVDLPEPFGEETFWEYRLQNRLNFRWYASQEITINAQMRTRFFAGDLVKDIPGYADAIDRDEGWVNMSWLIAEEDSWLLHYIPDRLNMEWNRNDWRVTLGRQRINWGINTVSNPNDLFNIYSFYDFDYPERPGSDALRIQKFLDWSTRVELAFSPASDIRESVGAIMFATNSRGYDFQMIGGYYQNRLALGGGWAGSIRQSGFKGEVMLFTSLDDESGNEKTNFVMGISADHIFDNSMYLVVEGFYNHVGGRGDFQLFGSSLSADNPSFSRYQFMAQTSYPFSPILSGSFAAIWYPDEEALFMSPSFSYSILQNVDLNLLTQIFIGSSDSAFGSAGSVAMASLKWNF